MKRKGISPLIAAVLLIAFTMAVASLFAQWAPQLIQNAQGNTLNESAEIQNCAQYSIELRNSDKQTVTVKQIRGPEPIKGLTGTWYFEGDQTPLQTTGWINDSSKGVTTLNASDDGDAPGDFSGLTLDYLEVESNDCDSVSGQYPPGQTAN